MLRVTKLTDYATVVLTVLANEAERVHSAAELAERSRVEPATVAKVLKLLAQAGLVDSFRGANGGYRLARPATSIPLLAIVEALEGPLGMTACSVHDGDCGIESHCGIRAGWQRINDVLVDALNRTTLADMLAPAPALAPIPHNPKAIPAALVVTD
ncbi:MAG: SUF system Fe-S cluster assembly regulator [Lysobacteraceae bacterium]|jgi:FeS assembly SUF system regulator|nr:SUF system Fe-S cluster assembly regulator [Xanthomonadaceae bacterium]MCZ8319672.1 SUF system Fe-S cluster assembly regulator [Silanimonas sp.]